MHSLKLGLEIVEYYRGCVRPRRGCEDLEKRYQLNLINRMSNQSTKNYESLGFKFSRYWMAQNISRRWIDGREIFMNWTWVEYKKICKVKWSFVGDSISTDEMKGARDLTLQKNLAREICMEDKGSAKIRWDLHLN